MLKKCSLTEKIFSKNGAFGFLALWLFGFLALWLFGFLAGGVPPQETQVASWPAAVQGLGECAEMAYRVFRVWGWQQGMLTI